MGKSTGKIAFPARQASLPGFGLCPLEAALNRLSEAGIDERGAIFTKREVVEFILDLAHYTQDRPLHQRTLLEPSFGGGDFLLVAVERLIAAWRGESHGRSPMELADCVRAVELHGASFQSTRAKLLKALRHAGIDESQSSRLAEIWLVHGDFLLAELPDRFDYVVGNPPYVRHELIPGALIAEYRARYRTIYDRADIYIPFIERSLTMLAEDGALGFICSDRWMKNRYGGPLRRMVSESFRLRYYVDMVDTPAFHSDVIAYPAIVVIAREKPGPTRIARRSEISDRGLRTVSKAMHAPRKPAPSDPVKEISGIANGSRPWILESSDQLSLLRRLERELPTIEGAGCKVGIGVATGADKAFIGPFEALDVEPDRKLPLAMTRDIASGEVKWRGLGVINPFADDSGLVDLAFYPKLRAYLEARRDQIDKRHIAQRSPANWYRTIDRIYADLAKRPKLLIPDIKGDAHIVHEDGKLYPHHNLYYIASDVWDLKALQAVLKSGIARLFVSAYSTRMRGGYLRFQAQYLRRIRLPHWQEVSAELKGDLTEAAGRGDAAARDSVVFELYRLSKQEQSALGGNGDR